VLAIKSKIELLFTIEAAFKTSKTYRVYIQNVNAIKILRRGQNKIVIRMAGKKQETKLGVILTLTPTPQFIRSHLSRVASSDAKIPPIYEIVFSSISSLEHYFTRCLYKDDVVTKWLAYLSIL